ncbi:MAG: biopolymer transporter ExbD [Verrucomicrobia bacterium]|nr:biopolymer transporter ExbD [Verrucomicrobiota bacterium]
MKGVPAYLVALGVVVVAVAFVYTVLAGGGSTGGSQITKLQDSVESLKKDVAALRISANEVKALLASGTPVSVQPGSSATNGGQGSDVAAPDGVTNGSVSPGAENVNAEPVDIRLQIAADGTYTLEDKAVAKDDLEAQLRAVLKANPAMQLIIRADASVPNDDLLEATKAANRAGIYRIALITEPAQ